MGINVDEPYSGTSAAVRSDLRRKDGPVGEPDNVKLSMQKKEALQKDTPICGCRRFETQIFLGRPTGHFKFQPACKEPFPPRSMIRSGSA